MGRPGNGLSERGGNSSVRVCFGEGGFKQQPASGLQRNWGTECSLSMDDKHSQEKTSVPRSKMDDHVQQQQPDGIFKLDMQF